MEYIQTLLQVQADLAAAFEEETRIELPGQMALPGFGRQDQAGPEEGTAEKAPAQRDRADRDWETQRASAREALPAQRLRQRLTELAAADGRIRRSGQAMMEQALQQTQARQGAWVSEQGLSRFSGGLTSESARQMTVSGVAGQATHRSMGEISRFFERDARRYGG